LRLQFVEIAPALFELRCVIRFRLRLAKFIGLLLDLAPQAFHMPADEVFGRTSLAMYSRKMSVSAAADEALVNCECTSCFPSFFEPEQPAMVAKRTKRTTDRMH
jgi:hypothetical protein